MCTSNDKSGYWQLHPDMWQYMGMEEQIPGLAHGSLWDQCDSTDLLYSQAGDL